jgi:hypothetical protein
VEGPKRRRYRLESWGWSDGSVAEALQVARRRLSEVAARIASGDFSRKYPYGQRRCAGIVRTLGSARGRRHAHRYGALVLNTARVPFIDVDAPEPDGLQGFRIDRTCSGFRVIATDLLPTRHHRARELLAAFR